MVKKIPHSLEGEEAVRYLGNGNFVRRLCKGCRGPVSYGNSLMVYKILDGSLKINVGTRKKRAPIQRKPTVQRRSLNCPELRSHPFPGSQCFAD